MIVITLKQKLIRAASVLLLAALSGVIYPFLQTGSKKRSGSEKKTRRIAGVLHLHLRESVYFFAVGVLYLLVLFIGYDMKFRLYPLLLFIVTFAILQKVSRACIYPVFLKIRKRTVRFMRRILSFCLSPLLRIVTRLWDCKIVRSCRFLGKIIKKRILRLKYLKKNRKYYISIIDAGARI